MPNEMKLVKHLAVSCMWGRGDFLTCKQSNMGYSVWKCGMQFNKSASCLEAKWTILTVATRVTDSNIFNVSWQTAPSFKSSALACWIAVHRWIYQACTTHEARRAKLININLWRAAKSLFRVDVEISWWFERKSGMTISLPKFDFRNIFCNKESSRGPHVTCGPYAVKVWVRQWFQVGMPHQQRCSCFSPILHQ